MSTQPSGKPQTSVLRRARAVRGTVARRVTGAALVVAALGVGGGTLATAALADEPMLPPDSDGLCSTMPESYPGNGMPVPESASCEQVVTSDGTTVTAEVWAWHDAEGLHWYNFVVSGFEAVPDAALTMCATTDDAAADDVYACTANSPALLFIVANVFVTWPTESPDTLYYCETVRVSDGLGAQLDGHACGEVSPAAGDAPPPTTPPPATTTPPTSIPTTTSAVIEPPAAPSPTGTGSLPGSTTAPTGTAPVPNPSATSSLPVSVPEQTSNDETIDEVVDMPSQAPAAAPSPDDAEVVALVEGARFPVAVVVMIAAGLGFAGVGVLVGPGVTQARRRHG